MLKIGEFSVLSQISIYMLRHYDEIGLLIPGQVDEFTGYRYYSERQHLQNAVFGDGRHHKKMDRPNWSVIHAQLTVFFTEHMPE